MIKRFLGGGSVVTFREVLAQVVEWLQHDKRVPYRALKREFDLDDAYLDDIKETILFTYHQVRDEAGQGLIWDGSTPELKGSPAPHQASEGRLDAGLRAPLPSSPFPEAERRQLTVMFCDIVGSTALSSRLDPEDLREVIQAYQAAAAKVIERYEGHIAQYLGDGLLVYFGFPVAHEDDAARAVYAALDLPAAMKVLNSTLAVNYQVHLAVRIGIHTGPVVVGEMGGGGRYEQLALGETPNIAARLEALAEPNTVVISASTVHLIEHGFRLEELGPHDLKGVSTRLRVARVLGPISEAQADTEIDPEAPMLLLGRDEESGLLRRRWAQSQEGLGQVVLVSGEAGIGKSALVSVLRRQAQYDGAVQMVFRGSPYHVNSALYPVRDYLERALNVDRDDTAEMNLKKLERGFEDSQEPLEEVVPFLADLLAIPLTGNRYATPSLSPQQQRQKSLDGLVALVLKRAEQRPVLAVWEDLHWADPSTLELLENLLEQSPTVSILHVLTFRPEFSPPWSMRSHMTPISLNRLERPQVEALVTHLARGKTLPPEVVEHIVDKTDGVPLYVEELAKMIFESPLLQEESDHYALIGPLSTVAIPATLQDSLMARLDRLKTAKEVAQLGAVLGREFSYEMLQALAPQDESTLTASLSQLVDAELLYQRGRPPRAVYLFKHALVQDAAYASLLNRTRQHYHQGVAQLLQSQYREICESQPELLAHHCMEAGLDDMAIDYWGRAGQRASQQSAYIEAHHHLRYGLELIEACLDTELRAERELALQTLLGPVLMVTQGYQSSAVVDTYRRIQVLCQQTGNTSQLFLALWGLWRVHNAKGEYQSAREFLDQLLPLAEQTEEPTHLVLAHRASGYTATLLGEFVTAHTHFEQVRQFYDPQQHSLYVSHYSTDQGVYSLVFDAVALWFLGFPDQALQRGQEGVDLAEELAHSLTLAFANSFMAIVHQNRRNIQASYDRADTSVSLSAQSGFLLSGATGNIERGWALARLGQTREGIAMLCEGLECAKNLGVAMLVPYSLGLLADAYGQAGQVAEALDAIDEALMKADQTDERFYEAELYRLKGECLRLQNATGHVGSEAEACFHQALDIARRQQAKSLELRAAMSLSRLWQQQGKRTAARDLLGLVYGWFTEGFDTADLQDAKELLMELEALGGPDDLAQLAE